MHGRHDVLSLDVSSPHARACDTSRQLEIAERRCELFLPVNCVRRRACHTSFFCSSPHMCSSPAWWSSDGSLTKTLLRAGAQKYAHRMSTSATTFPSRLPVVISDSTTFSASSGGVDAHSSGLECAGPLQCDVIDDTIKLFNDDAALELFVCIIVALVAVVSLTLFTKTRLLRRFHRCPGRLLCGERALLPPGRHCPGRGHLRFPLHCRAVGRCRCVSIIAGPSVLRKLARHMTLHLFLLLFTIDTSGRARAAAASCCCSPGVWGTGASFNKQGQRTLLKHSHFSTFR